MKCQNCGVDREECTCDEVEVGVTIIPSYIFNEDDLEKLALEYYRYGYQFLEIFNETRKEYVENKYKPGFNEGVEAAAVAAGYTKVKFLSDIYAGVKYGILYPEYLGSEAARKTIKESIDAGVKKEIDGYFDIQEYDDTSNRLDKIYSIQRGEEDGIITTPDTNIGYMGVQDESLYGIILGPRGLLESETVKPKPSEEAYVPTDMAVLQAMHLFKDDPDKYNENRMDYLVNHHDQIDDFVYNGKINDNIIYLRNKEFTSGSYFGREVYEDADRLGKQLEEMDQVEIERYRQAMMNNPLTKKDIEFEIERREFATEVIELANEKSMVLLEQKFERDLEDLLMSDPEKYEDFWIRVLGHDPNNFDEEYIYQDMAYYNMTHPGTNAQTYRDLAIAKNTHPESYEEDLAKLLDRYKIHLEGSSWFAGIKSSYVDTLYSGSKFAPQEYSTGLNPETGGPQDNPYTGSLQADNGSFQQINMNDNPSTGGPPDLTLSSASADLLQQSFVAGIQETGLAEREPPVVNINFGDVHETADVNQIISILTAAVAGQALASTSLGGRS